MCTSECATLFNVHVRIESNIGCIGVNEVHICTCILASVVSRTLHFTWIPGVLDKGINVILKQVTCLSF